MITALIGFALMAGAAMAASGLYEPAQPLASVFLGGLATVLMIRAGRRTGGAVFGSEDEFAGAAASSGSAPEVTPAAAPLGWAALLLVPAALFVPWPGRAALLMLLAGWVVQAIGSESNRRLAEIGRRLAAVGWTLAVMLVVLAAYTAITA